MSNSIQLVATATYTYMYIYTLISFSQEDIVNYVHQTRSKILAHVPPKLSSESQESSRFAQLSRLHSLGIVVNEVCIMGLKGFRDRGSC